MADSFPHTTHSEDNMITDFLKSMFPVDLNPPPGVPYIWCGEMGKWGSGEVGKWGSGEVGKLN
jgi:hypothetical protein